MEHEKKRLLTFQPDEVILQEGELRDEMYKILSGSVVVYLRYGQEDEYMVGIYSKSRCFGEFSVLSGQPSPYTVVAYDQVLLLRIERSSLEGFIRDNPKNAVEMMQNMARNAALMRKNIDMLLEELCQKDAHEEHTLIDQRRRILEYSMTEEWKGLGLLTQA